jgi:hypothetical protein
MQQDATCENKKKRMSKGIFHSVSIVALDSLFGRFDSRERTRRTNRRGRWSGPSVSTEVVKKGRNSTTTINITITRPPGLLLLH